MSDQLSQLVEHFGTTQLVGFILVVARVTPLFTFAPMFSSKMLPVQARAVIALGLSLGLTPVALANQQLPSGLLPIAGLVFASLLVGLAFAFTVGVLFSAVETAGSLVDVFSGFSFAAEISPFTGTSEGPFGQLYGMLGAIIFLVIGGDAWMMRGLARTFDLVPIGSAPRLDSLVATAENAVAGLLTSAVEVAGPVILAIIITDVAFGVVSRVVPQLNVFAVGFPMKVGVAMLTVSISLPFIGGWISDQLSESVASALTAMHVI